MREMKYTIEAEVPGHLGDQAVYSSDPSGWNVTKMHLVFDGWMGDDIVQILNCFLLTEKAKSVLEKSQLKGVHFERPIITKSEEFIEKQPATILPTFWWLKPSSGVSDADIMITRHGHLEASEQAMLEFRKLNLAHASIQSKEM
jgi:hypothetical protein